MFPTSLVYIAQKAVIKLKSIPQKWFEMSFFLIKDSIFVEEKLKQWTIWLVCRHQISQVIYEVNIRVIVFTVLTFSQRILKVGLKNRSFSKSTFPGLLKIPLLLILGGLKAECWWPLTTENRWGAFQNQYPKTTILKKLNIYVPSELPWSPHIYTGFWEARDNMISYLMHKYSGENHFCVQ